MPMELATRAYVHGADPGAGPRLRAGRDQPANDVVTLLEAVDVRIAAGLTGLRAEDSARDHLDQARELIRTTLHRADVFALAARREPAGRSEPQGLLCGGLTPRKARQLADHIELRLAERLSVAKLASVAGLSRGHFCRAFRVSFKVSPHQYIEARRIERVQQLMIETDQSLLQIALACGFNEAAHFSKTFRRVAGLSPSIWRRLHRG